MIEVLSAGRLLATERRPERPDDELWLSAEELAEATGWQLRSEGLCRGDVCVPLPARVRESCLEDDRVEAAGLWRALGRPVLADAAHATWMLGEGAQDRRRQLESLEAPDFTLPDVEGRLHSLTDYRGHKVLLATWASW